MSKEFDKLMSEHEECDRYYTDSTEEVKRRVKEEFENADEFLEYLGKDERAAKAFFDYSGTKPYSFSVIPIRKSDQFYVKKHTSTQRPYYHFHSFYEFVYVQQGKCGFYAFPNGEKYEIVKGDVCICAPDSVHAMARAGKKDVILKAVVPRDFIRELSGEAVLIGNGQIRIFENAGDRAGTYFQNFVRENGSDAPMSRVAEKGWFSLFLAELFREKRAVTGDIVKMFDSYMNDNIKNANLRSFSEFAGYNSDYLNRVIKRETGKTFGENVADLKLKKAKELLEKSDMSVERVAAETGYANPSGFYKQFVRTFGITPAQYRKSEKQ